MNLNVNLYKRAGKLLPLAAVQKVLTPMVSANHKWQPSVSGIAIQAVEDGKKYLHIETESAVPTVEEFMKIQEEAKDFHAIFSFGSGEFTAEGIQPFYLANGDDTGEEIFLAIALEGDFSEFNKSVNEPAHMMEELITPTIEQFLNNAGELNVIKLREELMNPLFQKNIGRATGHRGEFMFLLPEGEAVIFNKTNTLGADFDWGRMSQTCGYDPNEKAVTEQPKKKLFSLGKKALASTTPISQPEKKENPPGPGIHTIPPKEKEAPKETAPPEGKWFQVPKDKVPKNKKKWYTSMTGMPVPKGVDLDQEKIFIKFEDMAADKRKFHQTGPNVIKDFKDIPASVSAAAASVNANKQTLTAKDTSAFVLSKEERDKIGDFILKDLDVNSNVVAGSVDEIQQIEEKHPRWSEQAGITFEDTFFWKRAKIDELIAKYPKDAALLFIEMRRNLMGHYKVEDLANFAPKRNEPAPDPTDATSASQQVRVDAPAKKKFNLFKKHTAAA